MLWLISTETDMDLSGTAPEEVKLFMNLTAFRHHANVFDDKFFEKFPERSAIIELSAAGSLSPSRTL